MGGHNEPALMVATNKVGVAKQLSIRAEDGSVQTIAESTSPEAAEAWKQVIRADVCAYCAGPGGTIDHIVSRAMGGSSKSIRNWTGACAKCNGRRGSRGILYFLANTADNGAERRENIIKAAYHKRRFDIGPEVRRAIAGLTTKEERRLAAETVVKRQRRWKAARDKAWRRERKRLHRRDKAWRRERKRLHRKLVGMGHTSLDDPTAVQGKRHTRFGDVNRPEDPPQLTTAGPEPLARNP